MLHLGGMKAKAAMFALTLLTAACAGQDWTDPPTVEEDAEVAQTLAEIQRADPSVKRLMDEAHGYVVFPSIAKGGLLVGAAHGTGWAYEQGELVGKAEMTQMSVGAQAGGQAYGELLLFRDATAMDAFKTGNTELGAEISAVVLKSKSAANAGYDPSGVAVFLLPKGGVMAEASVGGQKFSFEPLEPTGM